MGEARRRGTYEERKAAAIKRDATLGARICSAFRRPEPTVATNQSPRRRARLLPLLVAMATVGRVRPAQINSHKKQKQGRGR